jgi:hypothetical protein
MTDLRVLVIAPDQRLDNVEDWIAAAQGLPLTILNRTVTVREVLDHIASGRYQIVHFATHGGTDTLLMSDGPLPAAMLEEAVRAAGHLELVVLGACKSVTIGAALYLGGVPRVLAWRDEVVDAIAGLWARSFYTALRMNGGTESIWNASVVAAEVVRAAGAEPPIYLDGRMVVLEGEIQRLQQVQRTWRTSLPWWIVAALAVQCVLLIVLLLRPLLW